MGNNETLIEEGESVNMLTLIQSLFYAISGLTAVVSSLIVILTVFLNKSLRTKDFYLLAGLAGADFIRGYGYLHGGILRTFLVVTRTETIETTPYQCMKQIYQTFMLFGQECSPMMVLILSVDRFLAVVLFAKYRYFGKKYALFLISIAYGFCFIVTSFGLVSALTMMSLIKVPQLCKCEVITPLPYFTFHVGTRCLPGLISIVLYTGVILILKTKSENSLTMQGVDKKVELRLTKNVALITLNTILFMTFPFGYAFLHYTMKQNTAKEFDLLAPFIYSLSLFGAGANLFIYSWRYKQFRVAVSKCNCFKKATVAVSPTTNVQLKTINFVSEQSRNNM